jgi:hypothetical protein
MESLLQGGVHVLLFAIFNPREQKLLNLEIIFISMNQLKIN